MRSPATDPVVLLVLLGAVLLLAWAVSRLRRDGRHALPVLPAEDRPPAGLGRFVSVGPQVETECRRGFDALEMWLATRHRRGDGDPLAG